MHTIGQPSTLLERLQGINTEEIDAKKKKMKDPVEIEDVFSDIGAHSELKEQPGIKERKEYIQKYLLAFKPEGQYSVLNEADGAIPEINKIVTLPNGEILLSDLSNSKLKKLDSSFKIVSYCDLLSYHSIDLCYIGNGKVVVSLGPKGILFANISSNILIDDVVKLNHHCLHLARYNDTLYIVDENDTVYTYNLLNLKQKRVLYKVRENNHLDVSSIAISDDGKKLYIASKTKGLVTIDNKGNCFHAIETLSLKSITDINVIGGDKILACLMSSEYLLQIDVGRHFVQQIALTPGFDACAICYVRKNLRIVVGGKDNNIRVFYQSKYAP